MALEILNVLLKNFGDKPRVLLNICGKGMKKGDARRVKFRRPSAGNVHPRIHAECIISLSTTELCGRWRHAVAAIKETRNKSRRSEVSRIPRKPIVVGEWRDPRNHDILNITSIYMISPVR